MSTYNSTRDRIMGQYDRGDISLADAQALFDATVEYCANWGIIELTYVEKLADLRRSRDTA
jgi:hypothetical protein